MDKNIKDLILETLKLDNSEQFFGIISQPKNACPVSESFLGILSKKEEDLLRLKTKLIDIPTMTLDNKDMYLFYVNHIDTVLDKISQFISIIDEIKTEIEFWRSSCLNARVMFSDLKKDFWLKLSDIKNDFTELNQINPYYKDKEVIFIFDEIIFEKYQQNCSFFHEHFSFIDQEVLIINLSTLKEIYLDIFIWGNQMSTKINEIIHNQNKTIWNLFLDDQCIPDLDGLIIRDPSKIDPSRTYICFTTVHESINYILKNGLPTYISFDHDLGENQPTGYDLAKFIIEYDLDNNCLPKNFNFNVHSANPVGKQNIIGLLNSYLNQK